MKKKFVLDTNILIHCPDCVNRFEENDVIIIHPVLEELDGLKNAQGETGHNAREASRILQQYMQKGDLSKGVPTPGGGKLVLHINEDIDYSALPEGWNPEKPDNLILLITKELSRKKRNVILVSNDGNMLLKSVIMQIPAQQYRNDRVSRDLYTGVSYLFTSQEYLNTFKSCGEISIDQLTTAQHEPIQPSALHPNHYSVISSLDCEEMLLAKYDGSVFKALKYQNIRPSGIAPRNHLQSFFVEALLEPQEKSPLVCGSGPAGTGKTLIAFACGLWMVENGLYDSILLCRPNITMGGAEEQIGFLPGTEEEKISPLFRSIYDNAKVVFGKEEFKERLQSLISKNVISIEAMAYLRGRSISNTFIIIDECQNTSPDTMFSILTRLGVGSKICIIGDPEQIDNPKLDKYNNGLVYCIEKMKESSYSEIVTFSNEGVIRSPLAKEAAERMKK